MVKGYMVMSRPTLIKGQTHEMSRNRILGYESRGSGMCYEALCWLDEDPVVDCCVADYAFEVVFEQAAFGG